MKRAIAFLLLALALPGFPALAQGVYVTPGPNGPIYSDKPQPGAKEMNLKPLNVVPKTEVPAAPPPAPRGEAGSDERSRAAASAYRSFSVLQPEDNGSVAANTALFDVRLAVDPPLQIGRGHAFVVAINGQPVGVRFTATEFTIPPEYWGDTLPPVNQQMQLDAAIIDGNGEVVQSAAPVRFFMRLVDGGAPRRARCGRLNGRSSGPA
jgi:hypothetical protein